MSDTDILRQMLRPEVYDQGIQNTHNKKWSVTLQEPREPQCKVTIDNIPPDTVVIKADKFYPVISNNNAPTNAFFFIGDKGECKRADYILVSEQEKKVIFIEMKKAKDKHHKIVCQLKGAVCLFTFCQKIGMAFWNNSNFLLNYRYRFVGICNISITKQSTKPKCSFVLRQQTPFHDKPENFMKVERPRDLQFNMLIEGQ